MFGISILFRDVWPLNECTPIQVTLCGIIVPLQPTIIVFVDVSMIALQPSRESIHLLFLSTMILVRLLQPSKDEAVHLDRTPEVRSI